MFGQLKTQSGKILLWLLALAVLGFVASLIPHVRRHMPWFQAPKDEKVGVRIRGESSGGPGGWVAS